MALDSLASSETADTWVVLHAIFDLLDQHSLSLFKFLSLLPKAALIPLECE